jgi:DNA-binding transcriptional MerR regulator
MSSRLITLTEAADITGKSLTTITRLARQYENTDHVKRYGKKFFISSEFVKKTYPLISHDESPEPNPHSPASEVAEAKNETITLLKDLLKQKDEELKQKNKELERKDDQIDSLIERMRESNIILQNLQTRLQIPQNFTETQVFEQEPQPDQPHPHTPTDEHKAVILDLVKQGEYTHWQIADYLNQHGYTNTRGGKFTKNAVEKLLSRMRKKGLI